MATGLRCYDPSGRLLLDFTDRVAKVVATGVVTISTTPLNVSVPGLRPDGNWLVVAYTDTVIILHNDYFSIQLQSWWGWSASVGYTVIRL